MRKAWGELGRDLSTTHPAAVWRQMRWRGRAKSRVRGRDLARSSGVRELGVWRTNRGIAADTGVPDARLRTVARPVSVFDDRLRRLVADMADTMYEAPGVGLAATQVDVHECVIVIDTSEARTNCRCSSTRKSSGPRKNRSSARRGVCRYPASMTRHAPGARPREGLRCAGQPFERECSGLLAVCIQHEMDHLLGKVFVEYLSPLKAGAHQDEDEEAAHSRRLSTVSRVCYAAAGN